MPLKSLKRKQHSKNKRNTTKHTRHNKHKQRRVKSNKNKNKSKRHNKKKVMRGGYGPGAGPVGYAWKGDTSTWPGAYASSGGNTNGMTFSNHYEYNSQGTGVGGLDPAISTRSDLANLHYQSGGGIFQDIVNLGDTVNYKFTDFFSKLNGSVNPPTNPNVTKQFTNDDNAVEVPDALNLNRIINDNSKQVLAI